MGHYVALGAEHGLPFVDFSHTSLSPSLVFLEDSDFSFSLEALDLRMSAPRVSALLCYVTLSPVAVIVEVVTIRLALGAGHAIGGHNQFFNSVCLELGVISNDRWGRYGRGLARVIYFFISFFCAFYWYWCRGVPLQRAAFGVRLGKDTDPVQWGFAT